MSILLSDVILEKIREAGFKISLSKETTLTREMAEQLYSEHKGKEFFNDLTGLMSKYIIYSITGYIVELL